MARAVAARLAIAALGASMSATAGCGDALLPSDFSGPPAGAVSGSVVAPTEEARAAERPRLALEWLVGFSTDQPTLLQQPVAFERSRRLQHDFDIDLRLPTAAATFEDRSAIGGGGVRLAVAKMVYFDDRVPDGRLDRRCGGGAACDELKAVSAHFVVFLERPLTCARGDGLPARVRLPAGYHYYTFDDAVVRKIGPEDAVRLDAVERDTRDREPTDDLAAFTAALLRALSRQPLEGC